MRCLTEAPTKLKIGLCQASKKKAALDAQKKQPKQQEEKETAPVVM